MLAILTLRKHACSFLAPNFWAALRPAISASYSTSLLEARKPNLNDFSNFSLLGDIITIPTPDPLVLNTLFTKTCQRRTKTWHTPAETPGAGVNSAIKSANTWPLMEFLGLFRMSNVRSLVPHLAILLVKSDLFQSDCRGNSISTHLNCMGLEVMR